MYQGPNHWEDVLDGMKDIDTAVEDLEDEVDVSQQEINYIQSRTQQLQNEVQQGRDTAQAIADYEQDISNQIDGIEPNQILATVANNDEGLSRREALGVAVGAGTFTIGGVGILGQILGWGNTTSSYNNLPQQGERMNWDQAQRYLTDSSISRINDTSNVLKENGEISENVTLQTGSYQFHYDGVESGEMRGTVEWYLPDGTLTESDGEADEIEFDDMVYKQVK